MKKIILIISMFLLVAFNQADLVIIDVRETVEFDLEHIEGAINIPLSELNNLIDMFPTETTIAVYCASGVRSALAESLLRELGFVDVVDLGGINNAREILYNSEYYDTVNDNEIIIYDNEVTEQNSVFPWHIVAVVVLVIGVIIIVKIIKD